MTESPLIQELVADKAHRWIAMILKGRFQGAPADLSSILKTIEDEAKLDELMMWAVHCPDLEAFRVRLAKMAK